MALKRSRPIVLRLSDSELAEVIALNPDLIDQFGQTRYGAWQKYFLSLLHQDLERRRTLLRESQSAT